MPGAVATGPVVRVTASSQGGYLEVVRESEELVRRVVCNERCYIKYSPKVADVKEAKECDSAVRIESQSSRAGGGVRSVDPHSASAVTYTPSHLLNKVP